MIFDFVFGDERMRERDNEIMRQLSSHHLFFSVVSISEDFNADA